jgi:hypothetical protein
VIWIGGCHSCDTVIIRSAAALHGAASNPGRVQDAARRATAEHEPVRRRSSSRILWVRPEPVVEVKYLTWTDDNLAVPGGV